MNKFFICSTAACTERLFDCQKIHSYLIKNKWLPAKYASEADLIVISTCSFSRYEDTSSIQLIKHYLEKKSKSSQVIIAGCMSKVNPQQLNEIGEFFSVPPTELDRLDDLLRADIKFRDVAEPNSFSRIGVSYKPILKKILNARSLISAFFTNFALSKRFLEECTNSLRQMINYTFFAGFYINPLLVNKRERFYYLRISNGCLGNCSYCAKKLATGIVRSKPINIIIDEFKRGLVLGYKDFFLLTEDSGCYGIDIGMTIGQLLTEIFKVGQGHEYKLAISNFNANWFVRYYDDLKGLLSDNSGKILYLQIPIQSASNRILRLMKRPYRIEDIEKCLVDLKKNSIPSHIITDMIVGFPGETEDDFNLSKEFVRRVNFSFVDVFGYEDRPNAASSVMDGKLPQVVIDRRVRELAKAQRLTEKTSVILKKSLELIFASPIYRMSAGSCISKVDIHKVRMRSGTVIRKTRSLCPDCLSSIDGFVTEKNNTVVLAKHCPEHGPYEILLSRSPTYYSELEGFYFDVMRGHKQVREYELWPTLKCNMECSLCCFGKERGSLEASEPTCSEIENFIKAKKNNFYILSGGEPTCRADLPAIIRMLKKHRKTVTINTNGLKLADTRYVRELKQAGLDRVNFQFDGFNRQTHLKFRGADLLDIKMRILENLKNIKMQTTLNVVIAKRINENEIGRLVDFASQNDFINGINFFTICYLGGARKWPLDNYIMPDELIDILEEKSDHKIARSDILLFQKLHLAIKSFFSQRYCFYNQVFLLVRYKNSYSPISDFLNLNMAEPWLDRYRKAYKKNTPIAGLYLVLALGVLVLHKRFWFIFKEIIHSGTSYLFKSGRYLKNRLFLSLSFSTGCDPYKIDYGIVRNCQNEIITVDRSSQKLAHHGREGLYCIGLEKEHYRARRNIA